MKQLKYSIQLILIYMMGISLFVACNKEDPNEDPPTPPVTPYVNKCPLIVNLPQMGIKTIIKTEMMNSQAGERSFRVHRYNYDQTQRLLSYTCTPPRGDTEDRESRINFTYTGNVLTNIELATKETAGWVIERNCALRYDSKDYITYYKESYTDGQYKEYTITYTDTSLLITGKEWIDILAGLNAPLRTISHYTQGIFNKGNQSSNSSQGINPIMTEFKLECNLNEKGEIAYQGEYLYSESEAKYIFKGTYILTWQNKNLVKAKYQGHDGVEEYTYIYDDKPNILRFMNYPLTFLVSHADGSQNNLLLDGSYGYQYRYNYDSKGMPIKIEIGQDGYWSTVYEKYEYEYF